jgi:PhnB protein
MSKLTPYLCVRNPAAALDYYKAAFGAVEAMRLTDPSGRIAHAEIHIGGATLMLSGEYPEMGVVSPQSLNGTAVTLDLMVPDVDAFVERAVAGGATLVRPVANQFYGLRNGAILDPFGHRWIIGTQIEELPAEDIQQRAAAFGGKA